MQVTSEWISFKDETASFFGRRYCHKEKYKNHIRNNNNNNNNNNYYYYFFLWCCDPTRVMSSSFLRFSRSHTTTQHSR